MTRPPQEKEIWFPAKRYGWGWGLPCAWQGWVVFALWLILVTADVALFAIHHPVLSMVVLTILCLLLIALCWWKGEKPRWRWGKD